MELHFCSQCGISIPLAEVQSGAAAAGDGRHLCSEHRPARPAAAPPAAPAASVEPELLFCANCRVSVPVGDVDSGRAKHEFGSLLCSSCAGGDAAERERRRKAVEAEMAEDTPAVESSASARRCSVCAASVPQSQITAGRALADAHRVVCPRCREAGAGLAPAQTAGAGGGTWVLVVLLVVASLAAGYFGTEWMKARSAPAVTPAPSPELAALRADIDRRLAALGTAIEQRSEEQTAAARDAAGAAQTRISEDLVALREDLGDVRTRLMTTDNELAQRVAKLEGQVAGLQEVIKGLAARPSGGGEAARSPEGPPPESAGAPAPPPVQPPPAPQAGPAPEVVRLIKDLLESKEEGVRFAAATELTRRKEKAAIPAFAKQVTDDPNLIVRRACARGLGEVRAWNAVPVLIQALEDKEAYVAQQASYALQAITAQDFGVTIDTSPRDRKVRAASATKWWDKNKAAPPDGVCLDPTTLEQ